MTIAAVLIVVMIVLAHRANGKSRLAMAEDARGNRASANALYDEAHEIRMLGRRVGFIEFAFVFAALVLACAHFVFKGLS